MVELDEVFRALADASRRQLLDSLRKRNGQALRELCADQQMTRQAVSKHLAVLELANLVVVIRRGREKLHYLNPVPINEIADRWISRYDEPRLRLLADLKHALEDSVKDQTEFVYVTYIATTPEKLWEALTEPEFTRQYWGAAFQSNWKVGSKVLWQEGESGEYEDLDQVVLESDPPHRLSYSWHTYQRRHQPMFGWTDEQFAELVKEPRSKVTFEIEQAGHLSKLTVIHDDFVPGSEMLKGISGGWPMILSGLKTLLETGAMPGTEVEANDYSPFPIV